MDAEKLKWTHLKNSTYYYFDDITYMNDLDFKNSNRWEIIWKYFMYYVRYKIPYTTKPWKSKTRVTSSNLRVIRVKTRVERLKAQVGRLKLRARKLKAWVEAIKRRVR